MPFRLFHTEKRNGNHIGDTKESCLEKPCIISYIKADAVTTLKANGVHSLALNHQCFNAGEHDSLISQAFLAIERAKKCNMLYTQEEQELIH